MSTVRAGLVFQEAVTLLDVDPDKLSIRDLDADAEQPFIELLGSFGSPLPEGTADGYTAFIDFDRKRYIVRNDCPHPELGQALPDGWERYAANIYIPDPKKKSTGVFQLGDPAPQKQDNGTSDPPTEH